VARLDRFIQAIQEHGADALLLASGQPASLLLGGAARPITRDALQPPQIAALLKEIAPAPLAASLGVADVAFAYESPSGPVDVEVSGAGGALKATLRAPSSAAAAAPAPPTPAPPAAAPAPRPNRASIITSSPEEAAARQQLERLLRLTVELGASDLHLRTAEQIILRKDGELVRQEGAPLEAGQLDAMLSSIMTPREQTEYRETGDADWAWEVTGVARFRCNAALERRGPMAVFRVIPSHIRTAEDLGLSPDIQRLCYLTKGLVLVTGPTGSGKSTTLAAMVDLMNRTRSDHILTIEDPIEFVHQPKKCVVTQRQVGLHSRSFKAALRAALREDPDIILVGEMRDLETISIALETAETGHLVFGTLHTTTAASTVDRIIDQFPADRQSQIRVMLAESLKGVIAQVLCRKIQGGRAAAKEVLITVPAISNLIREGKTFQIPSIMQTNRKAGMIMLNDALLELVEQKVVEPKEAYMKSTDKTAFTAALRAKRFDTSFLGEA
jgi:twitching motility protein PilT